VRVFGKGVITAAVSVAFGIDAAKVGAQAEAQAEAQPGAAAPEDEMVVFGRVGELRKQMRIAEDAVFLRFNDINSDDKFDIECRSEVFTGSRIALRQCLSNDWRAQDAAAASATVQSLRGESATPASVYLSAQREGQQQLAREMRRLVATDEQLAAAVLRLGETQRALDLQTAARADLTLSRQITAADYEDLPTAAQRVFEVRVGKKPWVHGLTSRTFTIGNVAGEIRGLAFDCPDGRKRIEYQQNVDWTVPEGWQACALVVDAKRSTSFMLFELE
jgi:hypothetical protein